MERQQLLKTNDRSVIFNGDGIHQNQPTKRTSEEVTRSSEDQRVRETRRLNQYEARGGFLSTVFSDFFSAKKSNRNTHSFVCDVVLVCFLVFNCCLFLDMCTPLVEATPVISEKHLSTYHLIPSARNIRHLPCISRRTKEEGVCMFAIDCLKANGTHLGTCIDRFYFGSCCQISDYLDPINDNRIDDDRISSKPTQSNKIDLKVSLSPTTVTQKPTAHTKSNVTGTSTRIPPSMHYITKKPITNDVVKRPEKPPSVTNTTKVQNDTGVVKVPEIIPSLKPSRHNVSNNRPTTVSTTVTYKPFYLPSRYTSTQSTPTQSTTQTTIYINNHLYNATKTTYTSTRRPATKPITTTTEIPYKISTFQTVQESVPSTTQKSNTVNGFVTRRPSPSQKPDNSLPFGTRLPSTTKSPTTAQNKPTNSVQTKRPSSTTSTTTILTTQPQKPVRPTAAQKPKPERPINFKNETKTTTIRAPIKRPQNSTLSNRRTTTPKPTTPIVKKPSSVSTTLNTTIVSTQKPTTLIYRPFTGSSSSQKPTQNTRPSVATSQQSFSSQKFNTTTISPPRITINTTTTFTNVTQKPSVTKRPAFNESKIESTTKKPEVKPIKKPISPPRPVIVGNIPTRNVTSTKPTTIQETSTRPTTPTTTTTTTTTTTATVTTSRPTLQKKPETTTKTTTKVSISPPTSQKQPQTTISTLTNEVDGPVVHKPTVAQKPIVSTTTEKIGLVTWSNFGDVTESGVPNITNSEGWSPATPVEGWVLLQTVSPNSDNVTSTTVKPTYSIQPSKKPIVSSTTKPTLSTLTPVTNETSNLTTSADEEFSTFMYVSGSPTTMPTTFMSTEEPLILDSTTLSTDLNATTLNASITTEVSGFGNVTQNQTNIALNGTETTDETASTEKSTVSPIEGITSTGSPLVSSDSVNMSDYTDMCGRRLWPEARIVGGARSTFGRWPWQISLRQWRTSTYLHKCGAALLNENWAITAAHCVDSVPPSDLLLRLGEHDLASEEEPYGFQERRVQIVASHPQFDPRTFEYDLALLRFYEPVTFQPNILPVCVPTDDETFIGKTAYVTGWGRLYEDGPLPSVLQEVSVPVIENSQCETMYRSAGYVEHIPNIFICAGWKKGGFDSCEGDSGGPMVLQRPDKRFLLAGVISWGIGCAEPNQPGVYTRISQFRHWINQILQF